MVPLLGTVFLWRAIYRARGEAIAGYDFGAMVFYFLLTLLASNLITPADDEWQIATDIREGQLNALLIKPVIYLGYRTSLFVGNRTIHSLTILPLALVVFGFFHQYLRFPEHGVTWAWTALSLGLAALLQFFLAYAIAMLAFWFLEISTVVFIILSFEYFLSGRLFPLDLTQGWFSVASTWLPFTYELFFPISIYLEKTRGGALWQGLAIQAGWVGVMWAAGRFLYARGLRHYGAFGG